MDKFQKWYYVYLAIMLLLNLTIILTPIFAHLNLYNEASFFYNFYVPTCHQWIYRSMCVFDNYSIGDCIEQGEENNSNIFTEYTNDGIGYNCTFYYSRNQIARMRAEKVERDGSVGYKFPNDARNMGIWLSMLIGGIYVLRRDPKVFPAGIWFILAIVPLGIDGITQMLELRESTNLIRFSTGLIAGLGMAFYIYPIIHDLTRKRK